MVKYSFALLLLFFLSTAVYAFDHGHTLYDQLLQDIVERVGHQTVVDYAKLKADSGRLQEYIDEIESISKDEYYHWSRNRKLAFLINAYNALTLKLIITHYPEITSIRELGNFPFFNPWKIKFFTLFGKKTHLDYIEHDLIRGQFNEPRIHFAINCAARGCPPLQSRAYVAGRLEQQLEHATRSFMTDPQRNRYNTEKQRLEISSVFKWFEHDFEKTAGSVEAFITPYITDDPEIRKLLLDRVISIKYLDYDWSLNDVRH